MTKRTNWVEQKPIVEQMILDHPDWGWEEIALALGKKSGTVQSAMSRYGVVLGIHKGAGYARSANLAKIQTEACRLWGLGMSNPDISAALWGRTFDGFVCDVTAQNLANLFGRLGMHRDDETRNTINSKSATAREADKRECL